MANKKSDSIDENAFQALEAALSIDFDGEEAAANTIRFNDLVLSFLRNP